MQAWEEKILDKRKAYEEGRTHVLQELVNEKLEKGYTLEQIADFLEEDIITIQQLIKQIKSEEEQEIGK